METKPFWASVTLWGAVATFIGILLPGFGVKVDPTALNNFFGSFQQMLDSVLSFGGLAAVAYGRLRANTQLTVVKK